MTVIIKDGADATKYLDADGTGTGGDPFIMAQVLRAGTAAFGKLAANAGVNIGDVTVTSITSALPAGTNAIGKLAANSGVNIGDVHTIAHVLDCEKIAGLVAGQGTMANSLPVTIASNQSTVPVKGVAISLPVTLTVTNGAYTIGDVVGGIITFTAAVSAVNKRSLVRSVTLCGTPSAIPYNLMFFTAALATPPADNAAFTLAAADFPKFLGGVPIAAGDYVSEVGGKYLATVRNAGLQVQAGAVAANIYAYLVATATTSPGATSLYIKVDFEYLD